MIVNVDLGIDVKIFQESLVNLYGCKIGDRTKIGAFVEIQKGVVIGSDVKIQSHTFICEGVHIEDDCFIGHNVNFINDKYPKSVTEDNKLMDESDWDCIPTNVKKKASIGTGAVILCGITIGEGAIVGSGSVVTKDVEPYSIVVGNPAKLLRRL